jgi:hypothetical protein
MASNTTQSAVRKIEGVHFCGHAGDFINGVAPRDLTPEEWGALAAESKQVALDSGLYQVRYSGDAKEA